MQHSDSSGHSPLFCKSRTASSIVIVFVCTPKPRVQGQEICPVCVFLRHDEQQRKICDFGMTQVTSSSLVQIRRPTRPTLVSTTFALAQDSQLTVAIDKQPPCSASTTTRSKGKELSGAPLPCLQCFSSVSCATVCA